MDFREFINKKKTDQEEFIQDINEESSVPDNSIEAMDKGGYVIEDDAHYFEVKNPDTGYRYDIPMLSPKDPEYFFKYIYYMKIRESSPETFEKLLKWD